MHRAAKCFLRTTPSGFEAQEIKASSHTKILAGVALEFFITANQKTQICAG
jgi:hypothetical protein